MKIQSAVKNSMKKVKEQHIQNKASQQQEYAGSVKSPLGISQDNCSLNFRLQQSKSAPRLHLNYDYAMIKGHRTLKGSTVKHKSLSTEYKPLYALMHMPEGAQGKDSNKSGLISSNLELPFSASYQGRSAGGRAAQNMKALLISEEQSKQPPKTAKLHASIAKKLDKYHPQSPIKEESDFVEFHPGKTTLPPIYPRKITHRMFYGMEQ